MVNIRKSKVFQNNNAKLIKYVNQRITAYRSDEVIYIVNIMKKTLINKLAPFQAYKGTKEVELVDSLLKVNFDIFEKNKANAFSNPLLDQWLKQKKITEIELVGVDGGGCVAMTAFGGLKRGFQVTITEKAVGTTFVKKAEKLRKKLIKRGVRFK